jgi:hypothetical protein
MLVPALPGRWCCAQAQLPTSTATALVTSLSGVAAAFNGGGAHRVSSNGSSTPESSPAAAAVARQVVAAAVLSAVASLADGQAAQLSSTMDPPITIQTPSIQARCRLAWIINIDVA